MENRETALVTGGAEGIGACIVTVLAGKGYSVVLCDVNGDAGVTREKIINESGGEALFIETDVSDLESVTEMSRVVREKFGRVNVLVNNAGISDPSMHFPADDTGKWKKVIETNLSSVFYVSNSLVEIMPEGSSIVNIASTRAFQSEPNTLAYSASKGGIVALTHSLAITLSERRIRANSISPGWIDTSSWKIPVRKSNLSNIDHLQHPSGRAGTPEDIAETVAFLCSREGGWINGQNITVDGGMTKRMIYFDEDVIGEIKRYSGQ